MREALSPNWSPWLCRLIPMRHPAHAPRHPLTRHPCPVSHHSVRGDVRRTWLQPVRSARPSPPPARPSLLAVSHHSVRGDVRRTWLQPVRSARPSPPPARPSLRHNKHPVHSFRACREIRATIAGGRLPERTKGTVSNTVEAATSPWVQIPYLPPIEIRARHVLGPYLFPTTPFRGSTHSSLRSECCRQFAGLRSRPAG